MHTHTHTRYECLRPEGGGEERNNVFSGILLAQLYGANIVFKIWQAVLILNFTSSVFFVSTFDDLLFKVTRWFACKGLLFKQDNFWMFRSLWLPKQSQPRAFIDLMSISSLIYFTDFIIDLYCLCYSLGSWLWPVIQVCII